MRDITDPEFQKVCGMNSFHGTMNSFHGGMNSGTRWNEFIPGGMNSFYSRNPYTVCFAEFINRKITCRPYKRKECLNLKLSECSVTSSKDQSDRHSSGKELVNLKMKKE